MYPINVYDHCYSAFWIWQTIGTQSAIMSQANDLPELSEGGLIKIKAIPLLCAMKQAGGMRILNAGTA